MRRVIQAMGWDGADATRQTRNAPGVAGPSAPTSRPTNAAAPAPHRQKAMPQVERLPLPPGVNVAAGQGLLEVDTGGNHVIYVDGVFVGRGPLRRVTLPSGRHEVRVSLGSQKHEQSLEVPKGARVRLPLEEVWK